MINLDKDVLFLIFEELQEDRNSLYSCLLVNKAWCKVIVPILWKNPWKDLKENKMESQLNVILSHLSDETKENLRNRGINLLPKIQQKPQKPLFNYIDFCRYLDLWKLVNLLSTIKDFRESKMSIIRNEILKLFINRNTKFTHLNCVYNIQIHLIPWAECCFSELKSLHCNSDINLEEFARICKSIKKLEFRVAPYNNNPGIINLIASQKNLNDVNFTYHHPSITGVFCKDISFCKPLKNH